MCLGSEFTWDNYCFNDVYRRLSGDGGVPGWKDNGSTTFVKIKLLMTIFFFLVRVVRRMLLHRNSPSVRPSVCLSHGDSHLNGSIYRNKLAPHDRVMFVVFEAKFRSPQFSGLPRTKELNRGTLVEHDNLTTTPRQLGNGTRYDISCYCSLIAVAYGDLQWPWMKQWPSLRVI